MKSAYFKFLILLPTLCLSQKEVFTTQKIYFYGYDFTHFKFVETKRTGQGNEIKGVMFEMIDLLNNDKTEKSYQRLFKKDTVIFDQSTVTVLNSKVQSDQIMGYMKNLISKDSLQNIINQYNTIGKHGIGFVQIMECFYRPKKEALIWYVFFDISSKKILYTVENSNKDADSYHGLAAYWEVVLIAV